MWLGAHIFVFPLSQFPISLKSSGNLLFTCQLSEIIPRNLVLHLPKTMKKGPNKILIFQSALGAHVVTISSFYPFLLILVLSWLTFNYNTHSSLLHSFYSNLGVYKYSLFSLLLFLSLSSLCLAYSCTFSDNSIHLLPQYY